MADACLQESSERLTARVDALAAALHASGVAEEAAARLLASASAAVLQALTLETLLAQREPVAAAGAEPQPVAAPEVPLAA